MINEYLYIENTDLVQAVLEVDGIILLILCHWV